MRHRSLFLSLALIAALFSFSLPAAADTALQINRDVDNALAKLYDSTPAAREMRKVAKAILVFPKIVKGGVIVGGQYGQGALRKGNVTLGYYNTVAASYGLQLGVQSFGYAMFLMTDDAVKYLDKSEGWELGVGPSVVIVDEGLARSLSTSTAKDDIYAFFFDQKGLMAGLGLQGSKVSKITPDKK